MSRSYSFQCGELRFDRNSIPDSVSDVESWPTVDINALSDADRKSYECRRMAVTLYLQDRELSLTAIQQRTGVHRTKISYFVQRCLMTHADGRLVGFRALIQFAHLEPYRRTKPLSKGSRNGKGLAGAFIQLLDKYPSLRTYLERRLKKQFSPSENTKEFKQSIPNLHGKFIKRCRELGIRPDEYPLNTDYKAQRSLATFVKDYALSSFESAATAAGADRIKAPWQDDPSPRGPVMIPYQVVETDGHKIHMRITLTIPDPFGLESVLELDRIWILPVLDLATRAALGYFLSLSIEYNSDDVLEAVQAALVPRKKRALTIPGLQYNKGAGFPAEVFPELEYICWDWIRFDNAKAHLSDQTISVLHSVVGCWPDAGPSGEPDQRPFIERFFQLLTKHFAHRLTGTTGSNSADIIRSLADPKGNARALMRLDELEELVEVLMANYNAKPHDGLGGRSPLEAMAHYLSKDSLFLRPLARCQRKDICLLQNTKEVTVRANLAEGVRPHIHFLGVKYSSDILSANPTLKGKCLRIYFNQKNICTLRAYFDNGAELGVLTAAKPWFFTPHSVRLRREINRLKRLKKISFTENEDAIEAYVKYKRSLAPRDRRAVNSLAKVDRSKQEFALEKSAMDNQKPPEIIDIKRPIVSREQLDVAIKPLSVKKTIVL